MFDTPKSAGEGSMISGDLPQNDGMEHEGHHQHVAGSGTAEGFSREGSRDGSDTDGRNAKDAAHALLEGLTASGANGAAGMGDDARGGGEGHGDLDSDRKGHDEEHTLLGGVGNLMTRARRGVNKYFSALAREQKKIAREQRNRARRSQSSNFDFLVGAEEGVGLLSVASGGDGDADAHKGGRQPASGAPIHRSQSAVFVPARPAVQQASASSSAVVLGVGAVEVAGGQADTSKSSYATRSRAEPVQGETSMEGGGQVRLKERDFVRMYHDEKQGAGEHSAQDENRERQENGRRSVEPVRSARKPRKVNSMPQLKSCEANDGDWKNMGPDHWADHGFKVLGVEIGHLPEHQQVTLLAGGVFFFLLIYGYMQEYLVVKVFEKKMGLFMTFLQFFGYAACAALRRGIHRETGRKGPLRAYFGLGLLQAVMQGLTNVSMMYLNYPAKVLFKSSRMVPIMCFGVVWQGRKYSLRDCSVVFLIVIGLATFMNAEARSSAATDTPCSLLGVACISLALVIDAANINLQEEVMNRYASCQDELIMFSYLCGTVYVAAFCIFSGELVSGFMFLHGKGTWAIGAVMLYCGSGFLGGSCAVALTKRFGALHSAITTTARKAVTLMLSFVYFQKALTPQHIVGATVFMVGLMGKIFGKGSSKSSGRAPSANTSPSVTPFLNQKYRKHLSDDVEESDPYASSSAALLPGGSGGGGTCNGGGGGGGRGVNGIAPSTVGREDSSTLAGNSGGHPVRHRGNPNGSGSEMDGDVRGGTGSRSGRWVRQKQVSPPRSPLRNRIASPPVTGLGYMIA